MISTSPLHHLLSLRAGISGFLLLGLVACGGGDTPVDEIPPESAPSLEQTLGAGEEIATCMIDEDWRDSGYTGSVRVLGVRSPQFQNGAAQLYTCSPDELTISVRTLEWDEYHAGLQGGASDSDIVFILDSALAFQAEAKQIVPLPRSAQSILRSTYSPLVDSFNYDGDNFAVPVSFDVQILIYNTAKTAPARDIDDWLAAIDNGEIVAVPTLAGVDLFESYSAMFHGAGGTWNAPKARALEGGFAALKQIYDNMPDSARGKSAAELFKALQAGEVDSTLLWGSWGRETLGNPLLGLAVAPNGKRARSSGLQVQGWAISANSEVPEDVLGHLLSATSDGEIMAGLRVPLFPANKDVLESASDERKEWFDVIAESVKDKPAAIYAIGSHHGSFYATVSDLLTRGIIEGSLQAEEFAAQVLLAYEAIQ